MFSFLGSIPSPGEGAAFAGGNLCKVTRFPRHRQILVQDLTFFMSFRRFRRVSGEIPVKDFNNLPSSPARPGRLGLAASKPSRRRLLFGGEPLFPESECKGTRFSRHGQTISLFFHENRRYLTSVCYIGHVLRPFWGFRRENGGRWLPRTGSPRAGPPGLRVRSCHPLPPYATLLCHPLILLYVEFR